MKNSFKQIFCILLLLVCLLPLAVFVTTGPSAPGANERLAAKPRLTAGGRLNFDILSDTVDYFAGHFGLRQALITANAAADAAIFRESATPEVLLGTDGWLYYADTLADYTGAAPMTARQLWCAAQNLALMQEYAQTQGAAFLFVCAPNKNTVYPAQMPARYTRAEGPSDLDRLDTLLNAQDVAFCDVRQTLLDAQGLTYYRTDSHWNGYGSALACYAILAALGREFSLAGEPFTLQPHTGDLYQMLYPASGKQEQGLSLARAREFQYVGTVRGADDQLIRTQSDGSGALLAFRDSFGNALHADLAEAFQTAVFSRAMPYDLSLMQDARPNAVLVELVERNLRWLASRPPLLPAPEREAPEAQPGNQTVSVRQSASSYDGLLVYTGTFDGLTPDEDSPVYAVLDGVCYEACPTAEGFQLLAPAGSELSLLVRTSGAFQRLQTALA